MSGRLKSARRRRMLFGPPSGCEMNQMAASARANPARVSQPGKPSVNVPTITGRTAPISAETGAATMIGLASHFGIPLSTNHTISTAIMGVGASRRFSAVRWGVAGTIVWAWVLTLPAASFFSALTWGLIHFIRIHYY